MSVSSLSISSLDSHASVLIGVFIATVFNHALAVAAGNFITKFHSLNTILALVYHINYYITAVTKVLQGEPLNASDKFSFDHPPIQSEEEWQNLLDNTWEGAEKFATLIEQLPDSKLWQNFEDGKYGNYYRNIQGIIEHTHYHLGQIVLIKKLLQQPT